MCDRILETLLKMRPHYSQSSRENATPSGGTSPLASYKEVPLPPGLNTQQTGKIFYTNTETIGDLICCMTSRRSLAFICACYKVRRDFLGGGYTLSK